MPTLTVTVSTESLDRYKVALGAVHALKDANGDPRNATAAECKEHLMGMGRTFVINYEQAQLAAANPPPQPAPVDMT